MSKIKITPKFSTKQIIDETIGRNWFEFQNEAFTLGNRIHQYMINYIRTNANRKQGRTGNLANSINLEKGTSAGQIWWGVGNVSVLDSKAPYYLFANYGGQIPGGGKWRPVAFDDGRAQSSQRGKGNSRARIFKRIEGDVSVPSPARPINYVEKTQRHLEKALNLILAKMKMGK